MHNSVKNKKCFTLTLQLLKISQRKPEGLPDPQIKVLVNIIGIFTYKIYLHDKYPRGLHLTIIVL